MVAALAPHPVMVSTPARESGDHPPAPGPPHTPTMPGSTPALPPEPKDLMDSYEVTVSRTEVISFTLPATSASDAEERYLTDGEETGSKTAELRVESVRCQDPDPNDRARPDSHR
jgi:hypothetical protein